MKAWTSWLPDVLPHVPGCPNVVVVHELRRTAQAFLEVSRSWQVERAALPVAANQVDIAVSPSDAEQKLVRVEAARFDEARLDPITPKELDEEFGESWTAHVGVPSRFLSLTPGVMRLYPLPATAASVGLQTRLAVAPSDTSPGLPDDLAIEHWEAINLGARSRLMLYPGKPWTNAEMAGVYGSAYAEKLAKATLKAARAHSQARLRARPMWL